MSSSLANLPILVLVPSLSPSSATERPTEREIDRKALVESSPDREELLSSKKSTEELRQMLKLRTGPTDSHWLYQNKQRANVNFRDATARTSTLIHRVSESENKAGDATNPVRRVLSTSSLNRSPMPLTSIENRVEARSQMDGMTVWGALILSTEKKLISPRPLGPTHILVVHSEPLSVSKSGKSALPRPSRGHATKPSFPNMDIPINDLLFLLSAPNLVTVSGHCPLPHRLHKELPRALLRVPHLETFHELIVYIHTMNQAELFRKLVPEWMRDLMHPLPVQAGPTPKESAASIFSPKKQRGPAALFGMFSHSSTKLASSASSTYSIDTVSSGVSGHSSELPSAPALEPLRTPDLIARDIVDSLPVFSSGDPEQDELVSAITTLNALKANLGILTRTLVHRATVINLTAEN
ncbi:hypothetical protein B0H11DRAFT_1970178 [Mycena galericulata]|nr:hypothetical protein B0H11DRAFT_1970178 [Mycena galericulata]